MKLGEILVYFAVNVAANDAVGPEVAADDAVGLNLAADRANNNDRADLNVLTNHPRPIPYEMWEKILCHAISQSDCS